MKLADIRVCDGCSAPQSVTFFRVTVEHHVINVKRAQQRSGLAMMMGSLPLADAFDPSADDDTKVATSATLMLCAGCFASGGIASAWESAQ